MLASQLRDMLDAAIEAHGDYQIVNGIARSGYGQEVNDVTFVDNAEDLEGNTIPVFDLVDNDESLVAVGGF